MTYKISHYLLIFKGLMTTIECQFLFLSDKDVMESGVQADSVTVTILTLARVAMMSGIRCISDTYYHKVDIKLFGLPGSVMRS